MIQFYEYTDLFIIKYMLIENEEKGHRKVELKN